MDYLQAKHIYENDAGFHALVDVMVSMIDKLQLTPSEIRQAAMFAAMRYENLRINIKPMIIKKDQ